MAGLLQVLDAETYKKRMLEKLIWIWCAHGPHAHPSSEQGSLRSCFERRLLLRLHHIGFLLRCVCLVNVGT